MAAAGPANGYIGITPSYNTWKAQVRHQGKKLGLPATERPEDAARWYDRAMYKLHGQSEGLNSPLSYEAKAELDAMSVAEFLAAVQVEKDKAHWARYTTGGASRFYGVSFHTSSKTWRVRAEGRHLSGFSSDEIAAGLVDAILLEVRGPSAMTNAKYHSGKEAREQAWQELKEKYRQDIEASFEVSGRKSKASKRGQKVAAKKNPARARANSEGGAKRNYSSFAEEGGVPLTSVSAPDCTRRVRQRVPAMAVAGPKSGYRGVSRRDNKWKCQIRYQGRRLHLPTVGRPDVAARWYDRAMYKLLGESEGLNFPLPDEARAELDAMSVAEFLAEVQVEKDKAKWANFTSGKASRFYGVSSDKRDQAWKVHVAGRRLLAPHSEKCAAHIVDRILLEVHGPSSMTNAKYHSGEVGREQAWQELKEKYRQDIEGGIDLSGFQASKRGRQRAAKMEPEKSCQCRATPVGRAERKNPRSEAEDEEGMASSSDEEDQWQSPSKGFSNEELDLSDLGSVDGSFSSVDLVDAGGPDGMQEGELDGHATGVGSPSVFHASSGHSNSPAHALSQYESDAKFRGTFEDSSGIVSSPSQVLSQDAALLLLLPGRAALNTPTRKQLDALEKDSLKPAVRPQPLSLKAIILKGHKAMAAVKNMEREE